MLRITIRNESETTRLVVEGKLAGACVNELETCWLATGVRESQGVILVDLSGVSFIDASGKRLLTTMHENGIKFLSTRLLTKSLIEEIQNS